jgi:hypothetical protein
MNRIPKAVYTKECRGGSEVGDDGTVTLLGS